MPRRNPGVGRIAATGVVLDPEIRRAFLRAVPPVARLVFVLSKRMAREQARQLGLAQRPARRRLAPAVGGAAALALIVVLATDPARRRRLQRLIVH